MLNIVRVGILLIMQTFNALATPEQPGVSQTRSFCDYVSHESYEPVAYVRQGNDLCLQELAAIQSRIPLAQATLQNFMGIPLLQTNIPSIGIACSGGGLRAAITALGLLRGLEKIGLLDAVSYVAGISGSTWTLASWFVHDMNLEQLTPHLRTRMIDSFSPENFDKEALMEALLAKLKGLKPFSLNDIWGAWLGGGFLSSTSQDASSTYLADIAPKVANGLFPIPLFCSAIGQTAPNYQWAEFSPFEIGSQYLNGWICPSAFGKKFNAGVSFDTADTENFGYLLGLFGSLYAVSATDLIQTLKQDLEIALYESFSLPWLSWLPWINNIRMSPPDVYNFSHGLKGSPLTEESNLTFVDAGFSFGLPFPPLLRRNVQIYIVCDASSDDLSKIGNEMHSVQAYANAHGFAFPPIDYRKLTTQKISVLADSANPAAPIIIYIPNFESFSTFQTSYTSEEFDRLMHGIEKAVTNNVDTIRQAIALTIPH